MLFTFKDKRGFRKKNWLLRFLYKYLPLVLLVLLACGDDERLRVSDTGYFPLRKGFYQIYAVEQIEYRLMEKTEDITYQLKTEVVDSFQNQQGGYTYTLHRSRRNTPADPWQFQQVWSVRLTTINVVVYEENIPFIKIVFPATVNRKWDGNALNNSPKDEYILARSGNAYQLETGQTTGPYIQIMQEDSGDFFNVNKREESYVHGIGLVDRRVTKIEYCSDADECDISKQIIDNGTIYVQRLIEYGQN